MFATLTQIGLPIALILIMTGVGMSLRLADFSRVLLSPKGFLLGALAQLLLLPLAAGLAEYPRVDLDADQAHRFCVGQRQRDLSWPRGVVAVFGPDDAVQGLGQVDESGLLAPQRRFNL